MGFRLDRPETQHPRPRLGYWAVLPLSLVIITVIFGAYELIERRWLQDADMDLLHQLHNLRGILSSLVVAMATAWLLLKRVVPAFPPGRKVRADDLELSHGEERLRWQFAWLIQMRWLAIAMAVSLVVLAGPLMHVLPGKTVPPLLGLIGLLTAANALLQIFCYAPRSPRTWILVQLVVDLLVLTGLLHFSGGLENPLHAVYLFHVIIAGVVLSRRATYVVTLVAAMCLTLLGAAELLGWVEHYTITIFPHHPTGHAVESGAASAEWTYPDLEDPQRPETLSAAESASVTDVEVHELRWAAAEQAEEHDPDAGVEHAAHDPLFVATKLLTFIAVLGLSAFFVTLIVDQLRRREAQLVDAARENLNEHRKLVAAVDAAGAGMVLLSPDRRIRWFNNRLAIWLDLAANHVGRELAATPLASVDNGSQDGWSGKGCEWECTVENAGQKKRVLHVAASPLFDNQEEVREIVGLVQDVTERRAVEAELMHASRMAALGRLTAGISHEIGNPLSSLSVRLQLLEERRDPELLRESISLIKAQIGRIARIVHGISGFTRSGKGAWEPVDVSGCLQEIASLLRTDRRASGVEIDLKLDSGVPTTLAVKDELIQLFLNIGINALEAMPDGGLLEISSRRQQHDIVVAFRDSGDGMSEEVRAQLFTPFFTTKSEGTGLGLSLSYQIVQAYGGRIIVDSELGNGSTFLICLPMRSSSGSEGRVAAAGQRSAIAKGEAVREDP